MNILFLYNHPHPVHGAWAESIHAEFVQDRVTFRIPGISRIIKSCITAFKIPRNTDLVLCESFSQLIAGSIWKFFHRRKKLACIVSDPKMHYLQESGISKKFYFWMLKRCNLLIPTSPLMASFIPSSLKKMMVFPYVNLARYTRHHASSRHVIIFTGRIGAEKGADRALHAFQKVKKEIPEAEMYFIGFGDLQQKLESMNIKGAHFVGWQNHPEEYLKKGSLYLSLARIEPAGIAVLEAMAMGLVPLVSTGVGNQYIVKKISQQLVVKDEEAASRVIIKLWKHPELLRQYSEKAKKIVQHYNAEESMEQFRKAMQSLGVKKFKPFSEEEIEKYKPSLKPYAS